MAKTVHPPTSHTKKPLTGKGLVDKTPQAHQKATPRLSKTGKDVQAK